MTGIKVVQFQDGDILVLRTSAAMTEGALARLGNGLKSILGGRKIVTLEWDGEIEIWRNACIDTAPSEGAADDAN